MKEVKWEAMDGNEDVAPNNGQVIVADYWELHDRAPNTIENNVSSILWIIKAGKINEKTTS